MKPGKAQRNEVDFPEELITAGALILALGLTTGRSNDQPLRAGTANGSAAVAP